MSDKDQLLIDLLKDNNADVEPSTSTLTYGITAPMFRKPYEPLSVPEPSKHVYKRLPTSKFTLAERAQRKKEANARAAAKHRQKRADEKQQLVDRIKELENTGQAKYLCDRIAELELQLREQSHEIIDKLNLEKDKLRSAKYATELELHEMQVSNNKLHVQIEYLKEENRELQFTIQHLQNS